MQHTNTQTQTEKNYQILVIPVNPFVEPYLLNDGNKYTKQMAYFLAEMCNKYYKVVNGEVLDYEVMEAMYITEK